MDMDAPGVQEAIQQAAKEAAEKQLETVADLIHDTASRTFAAAVAAQWDRVRWNHENLTEEKLLAIAETSVKAAVLFGLFVAREGDGEAAECDS